MSTMCLGQAKVLTIHHIRMWGPELTFLDSMGKPGMVARAVTPELGH